MTPRRKTTNEAQLVLPDTAVQTSLQKALKHLYSKATEFPDTCVLVVIADQITTFPYFDVSIAVFIPHDGVVKSHYYSQVQTAMVKCNYAMHRSIRAVTNDLVNLNKPRMIFLLPRKVATDMIIQISARIG